MGQGPRGSTSAGRVGQASIIHIPAVPKIGENVLAKSENALTVIRPRLMQPILVRPE